MAQIGNKIVMCPYMAVGHAMPMLQLANDLTELGFSITFVFPGKNLMRRALGGNDKSSNENIHYEVVDFGDLEVEGGAEGLTSPGLRQVTFNEADHENVVEVMIAKYHSIGQKMKEVVDEQHPICIILDPLVFEDGIVDQLTCPAFYTFMPFSATSVASFRYAASIGFEKQKVMELQGLGFNLFEHDLPADLERYIGGLGSSKCSGIIINSWDGIEPEAITVLRDHPTCRHPKGAVFPVGPRLTTAMDFFKNDARDEMFWEWLDSQRPSSVLFICFGSWLVPSDEQMEQLALGIEGSHVPFLWVLNSTSHTWLNGFKERTKGRGLVLHGWAPQKHILSHVAVGSFLMTCGWNSVMEALVLSPRGIALVAWPMFLDHFPTCRLLVDHLGIAVEVLGKEGSHYGLVPAAEVAQAVKVAAEADDMRLRARLLGEGARKAIAPGGSSSVQLQAFKASILANEN